MNFYQCSRGEGVKLVNSQLVTNTGYALDAIQANMNIPGTIANTLMKLIQVSGRIGENTDWNTITSSGVYKIQDANMIEENHAPVNIYRYGILIVFVSEMEDTIEHRILQLYFPHRIDYDLSAGIVMRMRNNDSWTDWHKIAIAKL